MTNQNPQSFSHKLQKWEQETAEDIIKRYSTTEKELTQTVASLISQREKLKDAELESLQKKIEELEHQAIIEETNCFKDVIALHRHLLKKKSDLKK